MAQLIQSIKPDIPKAQRRGDQEKGDAGSSGGGVELDPNLTCLIILNATMSSSPHNFFSNPAIATLIGVVIGWLLNFATSVIREKQQYKIDRLQRQEQAYSQLTGLKIMLDQLYLSVNDAYVLFEWIRALERLKLPNRADLGEIEEQRQKYSELILELARNNQRLWETIGLIRLLFLHTEKLEELIKPFECSIIKIREYRESISDYYVNATVENVNIRPDATLNGIEEQIRKYLEIPFEDLQNYLEYEIKSGKVDLEKGWWRLWK